jgi:hypothetical protein
MLGRGREGRDERQRSAVGRAYELGSHRPLHRVVRWALALGLKYTRLFLLLVLVGSSY